MTARGEGQEQTRTVEVESGVVGETRKVAVTGAKEEVNEAEREWRKDRSNRTGLKMRLS